MTAWRRLVARLLIDLAAWLRGDERPAVPFERQAAIVEAELATRLPEFLAVDRGRLISPNHPAGKRQRSRLILVHSAKGGTP